MSSVNPIFLDDELCDLFRDILQSSQIGKVALASFSKGAKLSGNWKLIIDARLEYQSEEKNEPTI